VRSLFRCSPTPSYDPSPAGVSLASGSIYDFDPRKERGWNYDNGEPEW